MILQHCFLLFLKGGGLMAYQLRFVQRFQPNQEAPFMQLEREFIRLEKSTAGFPQGRRYVPYSGRESKNTLIWECEFTTLEAAEKALAFLEQDQRHEELYRKQVAYFLESYTEIYQSIDE
jgi:hypothetical protein